MKEMLNDYNEIIKHYGVKYQMNIWVEELSELQKVICKWNRQYDKLEGDLTDELRKDFVEEMADVINCINQIMILTNIDMNEICDESKRKNKRTIERIKKES